MRMTLRIAACAAMLYCGPARAEPSPQWGGAENTVLWQIHTPFHSLKVVPKRKVSRLRRHSAAPLDLTALTSHPLLTVAASYIGRSGPAMGLPARLWCRDFINLVMAKAGHPPRDRSRRAIDALRLGQRVRDPRPGDLAVMRHHVTIVAAMRGGQVIGLGGNQGRRVRVSHYAASRVVGFVRVL